MNLKTAAFLASIGMILLTVLDAAVFLRDVSGLLQSAVAAMTVLSSAIRLFASLSLAIFLFAFFRTQS